MMALLALAFAGCGDWGVGDDGYYGGRQFNERFHYYYGQECYYDFGDYVCASAYSLSSVLNVAVRVEPDGFATLYYDDQGPLYYYEDEYVYGYDAHYGDYFQFGLNSDDVLTVYLDGLEAVYSDSWNGVEYHYYYDF